MHRPLTNALSSKTKKLYDHMSFKPHNSFMFSDNILKNQIYVLHSQFDHSILQITPTNTTIMFTLGALQYDQTHKDACHATIYTCLNQWCDIQPILIFEQLAISTIEFSNIHQPKVGKRLHRSLSQLRGSLFRFWTSHLDSAIFPFKDVYPNLFILLFKDNVPRQVEHPNSIEFWGIF